MSLILFLQLDHYPSVSYHLPSSSDTLFNSPKSLFLGKVIGKNVGYIAHVIFPKAIHLPRKCIVLVVGASQSTVVRRPTLFGV